MLAMSLSGRLLFSFAEADHVHHSSHEEEREPDEEGIPSASQTYLSNPSFWEGSNTDMPAIQSDFTILVEDVTSRSSVLSGGRLWWLLLILISWICC